jgi:hypothetical protein
MTTQAGSNSGSLGDPFFPVSQSRHDESMDAIAPRATGNILFSANPADTSTITLEGTVVEFVATPAAGKVSIAGTLALTLVNLLAFLNASADANLVLLEYSIDATHLYVTAAAGGVVGNAYTLVASTSPASHGTVSAADLAGGSLTFVPWKTRIAGQIGATPPFPAILVNG